MTLFRIAPILAILTLAAACSPSDSRSCERDTNCFSDERCVAGFCQRAEPEPDADTDAEQPDTDSPDADTDPPDADTDSPDADTDSPDADADTPDADTDTDAACDPGLSLCEGGCVNVQEDRNHCGECGAFCTGEESCIEGSCEVPLDLTIVDDASDTGFFNALAVDADGTPHVVYYAETSEELRYATYDNAGWHIETVATNVSLSASTHIYVDAVGSPHITYLADDSQPRTAIYARPGNPNWNTLNAISPAASPLDLAPGSSYRPYIVSLAIADNLPTLVHLESNGTWTTVPSTASPTSGRSVNLLAIAGDGSDDLYAAYRTTAGELYFSKRRSQSNSWENILFSSDLGFADTLNLVLTPSSTPVLATLNTARTQLRTYRRPEGTLLGSNIDVGDNGIDTASTALSLAASDDRITAGLHITNSDRARVLQRTSSPAAWQTLLDHPAHGDSNTSVAIDSNGDTHITFVTPDGQLAYIRLP